MPAQDLVYRVSFTIGPVADPSTVAIRVAKLIAVLKRDLSTEVEVRIVPFGADRVED